MCATGERECFGQATDAAGDDDYACDAWHYGEDPRAPKKVVVTDYEKIAELRKAGEEAVRQRQQRQAQATRRLSDDMGI